MAESNKFGDARLQFGDTAPVSLSGDPLLCSQYEAMLVDALEGGLPAADRALFEGHARLCDPCRRSWAEAQSGSAWLQILRESPPEPPASLADRIVQQTSGGAAVATTATPDLSYAPGAGKVVPFPQRAWAAVRASGFGQVASQPRLVMTAAMAFFSIALTMNLAGVRVQNLRPADLRPSNLKRGLYAANARVVQYYEGLRVVYELESRLRDMESAESDEAPAPTPAPGLKQPNSAPSSQPARTAPEKKGSSQVQPSDSEAPWRRPAKPALSMSDVREGRRRA